MIAASAASIHAASKRSMADRIAAVLLAVSMVPWAFAIGFCLVMGAGQVVFSIISAISPLIRGH